MGPHALRKALNTINLGDAFTAKVVEWIAFPSYGVRFKGRRFGWKKPERLFEIIEVNTQAGTVTVQRVK